MSDMSRRYLAMVEADIAERPFSAAAHLGEDDIGGMYFRATFLRH